MTAQDRKQRRQKVIEVLNKARSMELQAITQYMSQHYALDDKDYGTLAGNVKQIAIDEMRHAEMFAERIKEIEGEPTTDPSGGVEKGQDVKTVFSFDTDLEDDTIDQYNHFLLTCRENGDNISMKLLETILAEEQLHYNYFDNISDHLESLGESYLAHIAGTPAEGAAGGFAANQGAA